jgi:hypothetical protein
MHEFDDEIQGWLGRKFGAIKFGLICREKGFRREKVSHILRNFGQSSRVFISFSLLAFFIAFRNV